MSMIFRRELAIILYCLFIGKCVNAQGTLTRIYTFPGSLDLACCSSINYGFTNVDQDTSLSGTIQISSITVTGTVTANSPDINQDADFDWEVFVGPAPFGLSPGQVTGSPTYPGGISSSAATQFHSAQGALSSPGAVLTFSTSYNFQTGAFSLPGLYGHVATAVAPLMQLPNGLYLQVFPWTEAENIDLTLSNLQVNITYTIPKSLGNPSCPCGDPIDTGTGNVFEQVSDYKTSGQNTLGLTRYYNSLGATTFASTIGINWRGAFDRYIRINSSSSVVVERADGQQINFNLTESTWTADSDVDFQLTNSGSNWTLTDGNDSVESYSTVSATEALLHTIQSRDGYLETLAYNGSNQLMSVTDSYNRSLDFTYSNGLLHSVATPDGLVLTYSYSSSGLNPGVLDRLASVSYSTTPTTSQTYVYGNSSLPLALTGIIDEDGNHYGTWTYDNQGRGLTSQHAGGADLTTVVYNDTTGSRTVTNALGEASTYTFTTLQGVPKVTSIARAATSTTAAATETFTYDSNGYTASVTDWNGNTTTYVNNSRGEPTTIIEAAGTPQARTTTIMYLSNFHLPSQIVTPGLTTNFTYDGSGNLLTKALVDTTTTSAPYATNGQSRTWNYTWSNFLLASSKSPNGNTTAFAYDGSGALTAATNALGQQTKITKHLLGGLPQTIVGPNGVTTNLTYDPRLRLLSSTLTTGAGPLVTSFSYL